MICCQSTLEQHTCLALTAYVHCHLMSLVPTETCLSMVSVIRHVIHAGVVCTRLPSTVCVRVDPTMGPTSRNGVVQAVLLSHDGMMHLQSQPRLTR